MHRGEFVRGGSGPAAGGLGGGEHPLGQSLAQCLEDLLLAGEAQVDGALGDVGLAGDVVHRGAAVTVLTEHLQGRIQDLSAPTPGVPARRVHAETAGRLAAWTMISEMLNSMGWETANSTARATSSALARPWWPAAATRSSAAGGNSPPAGGPISSPSEAARPRIRSGWRRARVVAVAPAITGANHGGSVCAPP